MFPIVGSNTYSLLRGSSTKTMTIENLLGFLKPTPARLIVFVVFVGIEYVVAKYCWDIHWFPWYCPPLIHIFLDSFGYFGYLIFYLLACLLVHISQMIWLDRF